MSALAVKNADSFKSTLVIYGGVFLLILTCAATVLRYKFKQQAAYSAKLYLEASTDKLTGLNNRRYFMKALDDRLQMASENKSAFVLIFIDVNHFKKINDTLGHVIGDEILQDLADILQRSVTQDDVIGRLAGDEFAIATEIYTSVEDAKNGALQIISSIRKALKELNELQLIEVDVSIGAAVYPEDGQTERAILSSSDAAMYEAKRKKAVVPFVFYNKSIHDEEKHMKDEVVMAIDTGRCFVEYQPKIDTVTNQCAGFEALLRLIDSKGEVISPATFIPITENTKKMPELTRRLIDVVTSDIGEFGGIPVSLNVPPDQLRDQQLTTYLRTKIEEYNIQEGMLEIELTERAAIQDLDHMKHLDMLPITISIDDFGKGYSSLSYMYKFRGYIDTIKIDKEFTDNVMDEDGYEVLQTIIQLARRFKYNVVVEGVETEEQMEQLRRLECTTVQGFFYSKPMRLEDAVAYYRNLNARVSDD